MAIRKIKIYDAATSTYEEIKVGTTSDEVVLSSDATKTLDDALTALDDAKSAFTGTDGTTAGKKGLVPGPATTDAGKFLKADGTWADPSGAVTSVNTKTGAVVLNATDVGAIPATQKGAASGVAELDAQGKVPSSQLPSFVDDVIEAYYNTTDGKFYEESTYTTEITPETGKIYVDLTTNKTYRWGGSAYVEISESLALGTTHATAFYGDYGQTAYTHATDSSRLTTATAVGLYKVGATAEGHVSGLTAIAKADITGLGIPGSNATFTYDSTTSTLTIVPGA